MTVDREQIRRDADGYLLHHWDKPGVELLARHCLALLAELEQAARRLQQLSLLAEQTA